MANVLLNLLPWLLFVIIVYFFVFRVFRKNSVRVGEMVDAEKTHRAAVEAKRDRVIQLLEERGGGERH